MEKDLLNRKDEIVQECGCDLNAASDPHVQEAEQEGLLEPQGVNAGVEDEIDELYHENNEQPSDVFDDDGEAQQTDSNTLNPVEDIDELRAASERLANAS